jgi:hypothetical protein
MPSSEAGRQSVWIVPARVGGVRVLSATTSSQNVSIAEFANDNLYIAIQADGNAVYLLMGPDNSVVADETAVSGNNRCVLLPAGATMRVKIQKGVDVYMAYKIAAGATGTTYIRYWESSQPSASNR